MRRYLKKIIVNYVMDKGFVCKRCGECCNSPRLFEKDKERMKKARLKDLIYTDDLGHSYIKDKEGKCMFLRKDKEASCLIYPARPDICREYPSELNDGDCKPVKLAFDEYLESRGKKD
jgi:Fe-S-cluster containining protein